MPIFVNLIKLLSLMIRLLVNASLNGKRYCEGFQKALIFLIMHILKRLAYLHTLPQLTERSH
jgi:hypothetical protein